MIILNNSLSYLYAQDPVLKSGFYGFQYQGPSVVKGKPTMDEAVELKIFKHQMF